ncbi:S-layer homology domain-containing protein [Ellagibacter isourolithinifaciens]|uniref:S-layer homology domain-containing protein n=1 Tax=Ellagibacter isourolithinifaciens TaxID=2137581 RepID=UPI003A8D1441
MPRPFTRRAFIASLVCATSAAAASVMTACSKTGKGASAEQTVAFLDVIPLREGREEAAYNSALLQQAIDDASKKSGSVHLGPGTFYFAWTKATDEGNCVVEMRDNVEVRGSGKDATILKPLGRYAMTGEAPHGIDMFYYDGFDDRRYLDNASFYDFTIDGESTQGSLRGYNASGKGFFFKLFRGCTWERVEVRNTDGTGFGADYPVDCVMRDCSAIGCGKNATKDSYGASGFGVGVGFSEDESMVIENCTSSANTKFGFFFEHQSLYRLNGVGARRAKGFHVTNCTAWGNLINFGGNRAYDVVYDHCVSDQPKKSDDELYTDYAFTFVEHSVRILVRNATVDQMYTDVLADPSSFAAIEWALSRNVAHVGASGNNEFRPENSITRAEAAEFFWRYAGRPGMLPLRYDYFDDPSSDVSADSFCADAVRWLEDDEIAAGNNFHAEDEITIQEICLAMLRYAYLVEDASSEASRALTLSGEDANWEIPSKTSSQEEEKAALDWACEQGIVTKAEAADPKASFTRARMMSMLQALDSARTVTSAQ